MILCELPLNDSSFLLCVVLYSHWLQGYHYSSWVVSMYFFGSLWVWFCIHIGYRGTMILRKLSQHDSSNSLCLWLCIHIGYWGIMILRKLSRHDSLNRLCLWFCLHIGYRGFMILCFIYICTVSFSPCIVFLWLFWVVYSGFFLAPKSVR